MGLWENKKLRDTKQIFNFFVNSSFSQHLFIPFEMWWEVLPSLTIVMAGLYLPMAITGVANIFHKNGKYTARFWQDGYGKNPDWIMYSRDLRITGSEYIPRGLESVPDES